MNPSLARFIRRHVLVKAQNKTKNCLHSNKKKTKTKRKHKTATLSKINNNWQILLLINVQ